MASIIKTSINLSEIPKDKIFVGKKGKGPVVVEQTKEERESKQAKTYLGNTRVVWTNGNNVDVAPRDNQPQKGTPAAAVKKEDLPF